MKGINIEIMRELAARDVIIDERLARVIVRITPDNGGVQILTNKKPRLNVIAVIGPAKNFTYGPFAGEKSNLPAAVLTEIGIRRACPHHESKGIKSPSGYSYLPPRRKQFSFSNEQYALVAPYIFGQLKLLSVKMVANRKNTNFFLPTHRRRYTFHDKKTTIDISYREWPRGSRFKFSIWDKLLLEDLYWLETRHNSQLSYEINGLTNFIDKRLAYYRNPKYYKGKRAISDLFGIREIKDIIKDKDWPAHIRQILYDNLCRKRKYFYSELKDLFLYPDDDGNQVRELLTAAEKNCSKRAWLGHIELRITTGLERGKDHIVAEIFPDEAEVERLREDFKRDKAVPAQSSNEISGGMDDDLNNIPF